MGLAGNLVALVFLLIAISVYFKIKPMFGYPEKPHVSDIWWGPSDLSSIDTSIKPFKINVSNEVSSLRKF